MAKPLTVRVISGEHRGRKIEFSAQEGLRPTPDRVRETLFNWLQSAMSGARVLDAFAGTGILGIECLSRGAREAVFFESNKTSAQALQTRLTDWGLNGQVHNGPFSAPQGEFDLIFLDPPFGREMLTRALAAARAVLAPDGMVVIEHEAGFELPSGWTVLKQTRAGQEHLALIEPL